MNENDQKLNNNGPWWKPGVELFSEVSTWIVAPILVALFLGKYLDNRFNTKPVIFLSLAGLGFIITCIGIVRNVRSYTKKLKDIEKGN